jgi:two-component system, cell cycle sensor histidine kinase and response regulator CckA
VALDDMISAARTGFWSGAWTIRRRDGSLLRGNATLSPVRGETGAITDYVAVVRDTAREKELETQLRQAQKMEAIGTLAGGIAHDFNNILGAMIGFSELALDDVPAESEVQAYLREILHGGQRAAELVDQILTFSRETEQDRRPVRLQAVVAEALKLLRGSLPPSIDIVQHIEESCAPVLADPTQIHQVLMNLCTNAWHAMRPRGGILEVRLEPFSPDEKFLEAYPEMNPGPHVRLVVRDTGCGMPRQVIERIFDPYFTTKEQGEGTGLGLSTVHGIVRGHNGMICVDSRPGEGSSFLICLPCFAEEQTTHPVSAGAPGDVRGSGQVLLVDDEEALAQLEGRALRRLGYAVTISHNGETGLYRFKQEPDRWDIVVTDQIMPGLSGTAMAREILKIRPDIPIILCTGFSENLPREEIAAAGIREILKKPVVNRVMAQAVRRHLGGNIQQEQQK